MRHTHCTLYVHVYTCLLHLARLGISTRAYDSVAVLYILPDESQTLDIFILISNLSNQTL